MFVGLTFATKELWAKKAFVACFSGIGRGIVTSMAALEPSERTVLLCNLDGMAQVPHLCIKVLRGKACRR